MVFHTENLLVLHLIALAYAGRGCWRSMTPHSPRDRLRLGAQAARALTAVTYVLAGIAKLRIAGHRWLDGEQLRNQIAVDNLRKALLGDAIAPLAHAAPRAPAWFTPFSVVTLVLELAAPIALLGGRGSAGVWALGARGLSPRRRAAG